MSLSSLALDEFVCEGSHCRKRQVVEVPSAESELKLEELKKDQCLLNLATKEALRLGEIDQKAGSIEAFSESDYVLSRKVHFWSDSTLDRKMKIVSCSDSGTKVLSDESQFAKCKASTYRSARNFYCEKPRETRPILN